MHDDVVTLAQPEIRGSDSNSLLRLYDAARAVFRQSQSQQQRARAAKAMQRLAKELHKRKVPFESETPVIQ